MNTQDRDPTLHVKVNATLLKFLFRYCFGKTVRGLSNYRKAPWLVATATVWSVVSSVMARKTVPMVRTKTPVVSSDKFNVFLNARSDTNLRLQRIHT